MSKIISLTHHCTAGEIFASGLYCNGSVFLFEQISCHACADLQSSAAVFIPENSYICTNAECSSDFHFSPTAVDIVLDERNRCIEVLTVLSSIPLRFECTRYVLTSPNDIMEDFDFREDYLFHRTSDGLIIDGYIGEQDDILVPSFLYGEPVCHAVMDELSLTEHCTSLIVAQGIPEITATFHDARYIQRIEISGHTHFTSPPEDIRFTQWFHAQHHGPVFLGGYYCGTPGGGSGQHTLTIPEGTIGIAPCADFNSYWHRIEVADTVRIIGEFAFANSPCLEELILPEAADYIGSGAFQNCPRLSRIRLPDGLCPPVEAFQLCSGLQEVSMPEACWQNHDFSFSKCPHITLRTPRGPTFVTRDLIPDSVNGTISAYPENSTFFVGGRAYPNLSYLTRHKVREITDYRDRFGNRVRHIREKDPQLRASNGAEYWNRYWFSTGSQGVSMMVEEDFTHVYLVRDGIALSDIPQHLQSLVEDLFTLE